MKYLTQESGGRWRYQPRLPNGNRCRISLGTIPKHAAEALCRHIGQIIVSRASGAVLPLDTASWLGNAPEWLLQRLIDEGILDSDSVRPAAVTLGEFMELYFARPDDRARSTINQLGLARKKVVAFLSANTPLRAITQADAEDFRKWLAAPLSKAGQELGTATTNRLCGRVKEMLAYATRRGLIDANPFDCLKGLTVRANRSRQFYVDRELAQRVVDGCPTIGWQLIFALARFGGLRCPSEVLKLRWEHVLWAEGKINIPCQKTQRYAGREWRTIPLFPELRGLLVAAREAAPKGASWVVDEYPDNRNANVGVQLHRILKKAGIPAWPKLLQNLRFTRATELIDEGYPEHVVQAWIGNTGAVAKEHYRLVTDDHFRRAAHRPADSQDELTAGNPDGRVRSGSTQSHTEHQRAPKTDPSRDRNPHTAAETAPTMRGPRGADCRPNARERTCTVAELSQETANPAISGSGSGQPAADTAATDVEALARQLAALPADALQMLRELLRDHRQPETSPHNPE